MRKPRTQHLTTFMQLPCHDWQLILINGGCYAVLPRATRGQKFPAVDPIMTIATGRPATIAPNGVVTSPHALASAAGADVLRAGGSAVDAAIATSAALAVLYPHMTSIGGDAARRRQPPPSTGSRRAA
jgi:hypothetical protein